MATDLQDVPMPDGAIIKAKILNPSDTHKPLLLTCHGAPGLSNHGEPSLSYSPFTDLFRVLVSDLRGCGQSSHQPPLTHAQWILDLDELRKWAQADKVVFIGGSHGGFLGLDYTIAYPQHVSALLIGDTAAQMAAKGILSAVKHALTDPRSKDNVDLEQLWRLFTGQLTDMNDFISAFGSISPLYAVPGDLKAQAEVDIDEILGKLLVPVLDTMNAAMGECLSRYDVRDNLKNIQIPVFIWCGRFDWITPVVESEYLAANIKNSTLVIYEKSGHLAGLEEKTKFQEDVRKFLKEAKVV